MWGVNKNFAQIALSTVLMLLFAPAVYPQVQTTTSGQVRIMCPPQGPCPTPEPTPNPTPTPTPPPNPTPPPLAPGPRDHFLGNESFTYAVPLFSLPGRHGLNLNLTLHYNSAYWRGPDAQGYVWPTNNWDLNPGFRLDFGTLLLGSDFGGPALIEPSGVIHPLKDTSGNGTLFTSTDSTYIQVQNDSSSGNSVVTYKNGVRVFYPGPSKIEDTSGNFITINGVGGLSTGSVVDTTGRTISVIPGAALPGVTAPVCVTDGATCNAPGSHTFNFTWTQYTLHFNFAKIVQQGVTQNGSSYPVLTGVTRPDGTRVQFNYGDWGIVTDIQEFSNNGTLRSEVNYNFPAASAGQLSGPPTYTQKTVTTFDANGNKEQAVWSYQEATANPTPGSNIVTCFAVTDPVGTINMTSFHAAGDGLDGLPVQSIVATGSNAPCSSAPSTVLRTKNMQWISDSTSTQNPNGSLTVTFTGINARPRSVTSILEDGKTQSQMQFVNYDSTGDPTDVQQFDFGSGSPGPLLRETVAGYATNLGNIFGLPAEVQIKDGSGNLVSHQTFTYDNYSTTPLQSVSPLPPGFDSGNFSAGSATPRGNLTGSTIYTNASAGSRPINSTFTYDMLGNQLGAQSGCCTQTAAVYSAGTQYAYPDSVSVGPTGSRLSTSFTYDMSTGRTTKVTDPNGQSTQMSYDIDARLTSSTSPEGITTNYSYDDAAENPGASISSSANSLVSKIISDFLGRPLTRQILNGSSVVSTTSYINDLSGRPSQISNPYGPSDTPMYTTYGYDALGRTVLTTPPALNSGTPQNGYQANYSGPTVTFTDPANKQRKQYADALGRLVRVDEPGGPFAGSAAGGSLTVGGNLQSTQVQIQAGTPGTGYVTISGSEQSHTTTTTTTGPPCRVGGGCTTYTHTTTTYDSGTVTITGNGHPDKYSFGQSDTTSTIASGLANAINGDGGASVTASASGATVYLTARSSGTATNYSLSASASSGMNSFSAGASSGSLTGGSNPTYNTVYDAGSVTITIGGHPDGVSYGQGSTSSSVASGLASAINSDTAAVVNASASGATLSLTYKNVGAAGNISVTCSSSTSQGAYFTSPSFSCPGISLSGGQDPDNGSLNHPYVTAYSYDPLGDLLQVAQGQQTRTYTYDSLGRMISSCVPETANKCTTLTYTDFGAVQTATDPRNITTTYAFDVLNRVNDIKYSDGTTPEVTFTYGAAGAAGNSVGRLVASTDGTGSKTYQYDVMGRTTQLTQAIGNNSYTTKYSYANGQLSGITYPSGSAGSGTQVNYNYDSIGRLSTVVVGGTTVYAVNSYNAAGAPLSTGFGNNMAGTYSYNNQLQLASIQYGSTSTSLTNLAYNYSGALDNGQIQGITDNLVPARSTSYTYDLLGRLAQAQTNDLTSPNTWKLTWNYDRYGNRLNQTLAGGTASAGQPQLTVDPTTNHITTSGFSYDAAGNMTSDALNEYVFDAANRIVSVYPAGTSTPVATYAYDDSGRRVNRNGNLYTYSGGQVIAEYANGASAGSPSAEYIYAGGQRVATLSNGSVTYHYWDHLSVRSSADASANMVRTYGSFPFGETWYETGALSKWKFTTYENDSESGLNYAEARFHGPRLGRLMSLDPLTGSLGAPQSLNRYPYVGNDPINVVDPSGLAPYRYLPPNLGDPRFIEFALLDIEFTEINLGLGLSTGLVDPAASSGDSADRPCTAAESGDSDVCVHADPIPVSADTGLDWLGGFGSTLRWYGTFVKTFFTTLPSTGPGSCLGVFFDAIHGPLKTLSGPLQTARKYVVPLMTAQFPSVSNSVQALIYGSVQWGADPLSAGMMGDAFAGASSFLQGQAAALATKVPAAAGIGFDLILGWGLANEINSAVKGNCRP